MSKMHGLPPPASPVANRSMSTNVPSSPVSNTPPVSSFSDSPTNSPSSSSAKILERLGPSAKFKRKPIPPPLAVITTPTTPTNAKDSPVLPSPESKTPTHADANAHHSPVTVASPGLQNPMSASSTGLKSILKQRSLSNPSSISPTHDRKSPTNERKLSTNYVSPLASSESRPTASQITSTNHRSSSTDSVTKKTPPTTPINGKKKPVNQSTSSVFTNDVDERQSEEKKSAWRTPPTKQTSSNDASTTKKQTLDKIPKKASATGAKPSVPESSKANASVAKTVKPTSNTPLGSKVAQLTLERIDPKSIKASGDSAGKSLTKSNKFKRTNFIQSDSDTEKKSSSPSSSSSTVDAQRTKKLSLNNEITKRKLQHQQKPTVMKKNPLNKPKTQLSTPTKKPTNTETQSSLSSVDEKRKEQQATTSNSDHDLGSSDNDDKMSDDTMKKRSKMNPKNKMRSSKNRNSNNSGDLRQDTSMYDRIKKRARSEQTRNR